MNLIIGKSVEPSGLIPKQLLIYMSNFKNVRNGSWRKVTEKLSVETQLQTFCMQRIIK